VIRESYDHQYGLALPDGSWTGIVGEVQRGVKYSLYQLLCFKSRDVFNILFEKDKQKSTSPFLSGKCPFSRETEFLYAVLSIVLWRCPSVRDHFSFPDFFLLPSLQLLHQNLVYCFVVKSYSSSSRFSVVGSFLQ
jgi:hypothetical protein